MIGSLSGYSAYAASVFPVYDTKQASKVEDKQEISYGKNSSTDSSQFDGEINDQAIISDQAMALIEKDKTETQDGLPKNNDDEQEPQNNLPQNNSLPGDKELNPQQEQEIAKLKLVDAEVRAHEQAHIAAATGLNVSAPSFGYETGPDGKKYAVNGEVSISFSGSNDPEENIANAEKLKAAALAPADPSSQDLSVARNADQLILKYKQEEMKLEQAKENPPETTESQAPTESQTTSEPQAPEPAPEQVSEPVPTPAQEPAEQQPLIESQIPAEPQKAAEPQSPIEQQTPVEQQETAKQPINVRPQNITTTATPLNLAPQAL